MSLRVTFYTPCCATPISMRNLMNVRTWLSNVVLLHNENQFHTRLLHPHMP